MYSYSARALTLCEKYGLQSYTPKEYAEKVLGVKGKELKKIEVIYHLFDYVEKHAFMDDAKEFIMNNPCVCIVDDGYNAMLFIEGS